MFERGVIPGTSVPSLIKSFAHSNSSGSLVFRSEHIEKKVLFWHGNITSASSTLIDDRMGEVIYRKGFLSLDEFIAAAGKVTQKIRFGDALIHSGVFNPLDLWDALNLQSKEVLASLCFYPSLEVSFEENKCPPKNELLLQFSVDEVLDDALAEAEAVNLFQKLAEANPALELEPGCESLVCNDFLKDMVGLVEKTKNFRTLVQTESRLSAIYTTRAVFELYVRGILVDNFGYARSIIHEGTERLFREIVEDANFMFVEIHNAARNENISDWEKIVEYTDKAMTRMLGSGVFIRPERGFIFENILRVCLCTNSIRDMAMSRSDRIHWLDLPFDALSDCLYSAVLQLFFELYNRKFNSTEFARVKAMIDKMKFPEG